MNNNSLNLKIKTYKPLREEIYDSLRNAIINGDIKSGIRLVETHVAEQLGVSRTPVREAIHKLELEGLVSSHPSKGLIVNEVSVEDIEEIQGLRMILESYAVRLAAKNIKDGDLKRLEETINQSEEALKKGDINRVMMFNTRFHDLIYSISGSKRLENLIRQLNEHILRFRKAALHTKGHAEQALREHRLILKALKMRDPDYAHTLVSQHISENTKAVLKWAGK